MALIVGLAAVAACATYLAFPGAGAAPVADQLNPGGLKAVALGGLLGQGHVNPYAQQPAPIVTATAHATVTKRHKPGPVHSTAPTVPAGSAPAGTSGGGGSPFVDAGGIGFYDGTSSPSGIETAASWLGGTSTVKYAMDFIDATDFSHISNPWQLGNWKGSPFSMVWGVPMLPCGSPATQCSTNVSAFNQVASGGADSDYKTLAQNLISAGYGSSYIRLGWEFNAGWMGWSICNSDNSGLTSWASDFVPAFQNIVTSMRSVSGANFKFIWNPIESSNASCAGASLENFYPGDKYVDDVSLDVYDGIGANDSDSVRWTDLLNGVNSGGWTAVRPDAINGQQFPGYGLNWLAAFGKAHDKEVGLPEWGLDASGQNGGGGDDTYFMTQMADWIKTNGTGPAIFWNCSGGTMALNIPNYTSGADQNATAAFKSAFGG